MEIKRRCFICNIVKPRKCFKRSNTCIECKRIKRENNREFLKREVCGIRKREDIIREARERQIILKPKRVLSICFHLTKIEKQLLWKKYIKIGLSYEEADKRIESNIKYLQFTLENLRNQVSSDKELNIRFKEEFAKLLENGHS